MKKLLKKFSARFLPNLFFVLAMVSLVISPKIMQGQEPAQPAQPVQEFPFSPEHLLNFFDANQKISPLNRTTQERINQTVAERNLSMERFNQIARASQIGELANGIFTEAEIAAFNEAAPLVTAIQREMQDTMRSLLDAENLTMEKYQQILGEFRANQALQEHVRNLLRERARQAAREAREREQQLQQQQPPQSQQ
ncbi:MAG TPA: hypothetical protein DCM62_06190 [Bacteroidales bacterium]|nr:hypothetical protein [Bacteroidales bacterium]